MPSKPDPRHNKLCQRCTKKCKQQKSVTIITCPDFEGQPVQMTVPLKFPRGRPKKTSR
ncbi:MAG: hypothetical protein K0B87_03085 [Candidatus Syntrophosphaera sp.]|nr:hypothetical protein [Candidatus Syntrophosphaera sp.]